MGKTCIVRLQDCEFYVHKNDHQRESEDVEQKRRRHRDISQPGPLPPQQINGRDRTDSPFSTSTADRNTSVTATSSSGWQSSENLYSVEADCVSTDSPFSTSTADRNTSVTATSSSGWQSSENPYSVEADCANMDRWYPSVPGNLSTYYASNLTSIEEDLWDENLNLGNLSTYHASNVEELPWDENLILGNPLTYDASNSTSIEELLWHENLILGNPSTYHASNPTSIKEPLWHESLIPGLDGSTSNNAIYPPIFDVPASSSHQETSTATQYLHPSPPSPQPEFDDLSHASSSAPLGNGGSHCWSNPTAIQHKRRVANDNGALRYQSHGVAHLQHNANGVLARSHCLHSGMGQRESRATQKAAEAEVMEGSGIAIVPHSSL